MPVCLLGAGWCGFARGSAGDIFVLPRIVLCARGLRALLPRGCPQRISRGDGATVAADAGAGEDPFDGRDSFGRGGGGGGLFGGFGEGGGGGGGGFGGPRSGDGRGVDLGEFLRSAFGGFFDGPGDPAAAAPPPGARARGVC